MINIKDDFYNLRNTHDLSRLLDVSYSKLVYYLYKFPDSKYVSFDLNKKAGGIRKIQAPIPQIRYVQRKLLDVLYEVYVPRPSVHGAVRGRSIVTNASVHLKSKYVINFDLKDFFPSIHFGRVKGMLMAHPYKLPEDVATVISNICCHNSELPQGAPTSPIVANMICHGMDRSFQRLAKKHGFFYTRYFDDITFSTKRKIIPNGVSYRLDDESKKYVLGQEVMDIVNKSGFQINDKKTRVQNRNESQVVTGLKVNRTLNLDRKYIRQIRAMLHAWERYGYKLAMSEFMNKHNSKNRFALDAEYRRVVKGKIDFLKMVRGGENEIYKKLIKKYRILETRDFSDDVLYKRPVFSEEHLRSAIFVIEYEWTLNDEYDCSQGTAFALDGIGFVTCAHILPPDDAVITRAQAWRCGNVLDKYSVEIIKSHKAVDLATINIGTAVDHPLTKIAGLTYFGHNSKVIVAGFPNYKTSDDLYISSGHVTQRTKVSGVDRFIISAAIVGGNSGGPILNESNHVVGVAATGVSGGLQHGATHNHSFIPISALKYLED